MYNTSLSKPLKISIYVIFLLFTHSLQSQQWNADAGYIPSLTIGKTPIPSSGTDADLGIDGSPNNHWTSGAPLPQNYIARADQNDLMGTAASLCTHSGIANVLGLTDGSTAGSINVPIDGTGEAWIKFTFPNPQEVLLISTKFNTATDIEIYINDGTGDVLANTYTPSENYSVKRTDIGTPIQSFTIRSSAAFSVFEVAGLYDVPKEFYAVDLGGIQEIGHIHTKHWAGSGDGSGAATAAALYLSEDNVNWTKIRDLNPHTLGVIQTEIYPVMSARYIKVEYDVVPNDWNKVFLFELSAYDRHNIFGATPVASQGTKTLGELMGLNAIWGWGHSAYSSSLVDGEGPFLHNAYASHARNYHNMNWDILDPDNTPDYTTMAAGGGTEAQWWLNWVQEYTPWVNAGLEVQTTITIKDYINDWDTPYQSAYNYGYAFANHFGPTNGNGLVTSMEVGNEPWFYGATLYNDVLRGMAEGAKAADPNMLVFPCAFQAHDPFAEEDLSYFKNYMGARITATEAASLDGLNIHNYSYARLDDGGNGTRLGVHPEHPASGMREVFNAIRFRNDNMPGKLIYLSEWGWDFPGDNSLCTHEECVSKEAAAYYSVRAALHYMRLGIDRITWFFYADGTGTNSSLYTRSGLTESTDHNFTKKTVFYAFEAMKNRLGDLYFIDAIQEDKDAYIYALGDPSGNISHYVAWKPIDGNDATTSMVTFNIGMQEPLVAYHIKGEDPMGTNTALPSFSGGNITAELSTIPLVIEVGISLPVELIGFKGVCADNEIQLSWETASEINHFHFEIYKKDGVAAWKLLGEVRSNESNEYTFSDDSLNGTNLYRLKQVDIDGKYKYSDIISVANCDSEKISVYPNPTNDLLFIQYQSTKEKNVSFNILDARGVSTLNLERKLQKGIQTIELDVSTLPKGIYFIELLSNGREWKEKIIIL